MSLAVVHRAPFALGPVVMTMPAGLSLAEIVARADVAPPERVVVTLCGEVIPRAAWPLVRPKGGLGPGEVALWTPPRGGGGEGQDAGKAIGALIAAIALSAATGFIAGGGLFRAGILGPAFGAGKFGATALAAGVSVVGSLLIGALSPPPVRSPDADDFRAPGSAGAGGNVLEPDGALPRVAGTRRVSPPLGAEPLIYLEGEDEVVEAFYVMAGPHRLEDVRIGNAPVQEVLDVEVETREGWPGEVPPAFLTRQSRTEALQSELRGHEVAASDGVTLESATGDTARAQPQPLTVLTRTRPCEVWLHLVFPQGLALNASSSDGVRVPFRLRIRAEGAETWINLPELHYQAATPRQKRVTIRLVWDDEELSAAAPATEGWVEARVGAPGQSVAPAQPAWEADASFVGSGDTWMASNNLGTTGVSRVVLTRYEARMNLDPAVFTSANGRFEIEVRRGFAFRAASWSAAAYTLGGSVWDLYGFRLSGSAAVIGQSRAGMADTVAVLRAVNVWNEAPLPVNSGLSVVAVRARNRRVDQVSALASGYVPDWDGAAWADWKVTPNPAPHLRDIYAGGLNADPVPAPALDNDGLVAWRAACATAGHEVHAVFEGTSVSEAARIVASAGYGRPWMAERWGVVHDYDRSAEAPVQVFSPRNAANLRVSRAFARLPDGFRVTFPDAGRDYAASQITVMRPGRAPGAGLMEQLTFEAQVDEGRVRARAAFDLAQAEARSTFYAFDAPAEAIVCRRGSLIGLTHDTLDVHAGQGRVIDWETDAAGDVTAVLLDDEVDVRRAPGIEEVHDLRLVGDMLRLGLRSGLALRRSGGAITLHEVAGAEGPAARLALETPAAPEGMAAGILAVAGLLGREYRRLIVAAIEPREDLSATLTCVDEAQELFA